MKWSYSGLLSCCNSIGNEVTSSENLLHRNRVCSSKFNLYSTGTYIVYTVACGGSVMELDDTKI